MRPRPAVGSGPTLVWFGQDLRLADNPALLAAVDRGGPVIPIYIWSPAEEGDWPPGAASRWWLHQSLAALAGSLERRGSRLVLRAGPALEVLRDLIAATGATAVHWNRRHEPAARAREAAVRTALGQDGIETGSHNATLLFDPDEIRTRSGGPYRVFTPFWRACGARPEPEPPRAAPARLPAPIRWPASLALTELGLEPTVDWAAGLRAAWRPGEAGAARELRKFLAASVCDYPRLRDRPDVVGTSRLSPSLHHGEIGPRQVWHAVRRAQLGGGARTGAAGSESFLRQIVWREFASHLLIHFPDTPRRPLRPEFERFPWSRSRSDLRAWQQGRTGYTIVDAGMRELWATGWMHNRVRMIVGSFLVKDLLVSWVEGARWFWDTLVDADLANNTLGWQWVAGCGADAAPFFRIFNPDTQGRRFDPEGVYVRRWIPAASGRGAGDAPTRVSPRPVVDHAAARRRALEIYRRGTHER